MRLLPLLSALLLAACGGEPAPIKNACDALRVMLRPELVSKMREAGKFDLPAENAPCPFGYPIEVKLGDQTVMMFHETNVADMTTSTVATTAAVETCIALELTPTFKDGDETARAMWVYDTLKKLGSVQVDPEKMEGCKRIYPLRIKVDGETIFEIELAKGPWVNVPEVKIVPPPPPTLPTDERFHGQMVPLGDGPTTTLPSNAETGDLE